MMNAAGGWACVSTASHANKVTGVTWMGGLKTAAFTTAPTRLVTSCTDEKVR
jgi:hypothetical protein